MERCSFCKKEISTSLIKRVNLLPEDFNQKVADFFPDNFPIQPNSFCSNCLSFNGGNRVIYSTYEENFKKWVSSNELESIRHKLKAIEKKLEEEGDEEGYKKKYISKDLNSIAKRIKVFSVLRNDLELVAYGDVMEIVDSGMLATSSDNFNGVWGVVFDNIAREGLDSENRLSKALDVVKKKLMIKCAYKLCDTIVDFKYSFSELAGNGKILVLASGTFAKSNECIDIFKEVNQNAKESLSDIDSLKPKRIQYQERIKELEEKVHPKHPSQFKKFVGSLIPKYNLD